MYLGAGRTRGATILMHMCAIAAGLGTIIQPSRVVYEAAGVWAYIWAAMFIVGGALCAFAAWKRNFLLEIGGLPMVIGGYVICAFILFASWWANHENSASFIVGWLLTGAAIGMTGRLIEMRRLSHISSEALSRQRKREE